MQRPSETAPAMTSQPADSRLLHPSPTSSSSQAAPPAASKPAPQPALVPIPAMFAAAPAAAAAYGLTQGAAFPATVAAMPQPLLIGFLPPPAAAAGDAATWGTYLPAAAETAFAPFAGMCFYPAAALTAAGGLSLATPGGFYITPDLLARPVAGDHRYDPTVRNLLECRRKRRLKSSSSRSATTTTRNDNVSESTGAYLSVVESAVEKGSASLTTDEEQDHEDATYSGDKAPKKFKPDFPLSQPPATSISQLTTRDDDEGAAPPPPLAPKEESVTKELPPPPAKVLLPAGRNNSPPPLLLANPDRTKRPPRKRRKKPQPQTVVVIMDEPESTNLPLDRRTSSSDEDDSTRVVGGGGPRRRNKSVNNGGGVAAAREPSSASAAGVVHEKHEGGGGCCGSIISEKTVTMPTRSSMRTRRPTQRFTGFLITSTDDDSSVVLPRPPGEKDGLSVSAEPVAANIFTTSAVVPAASTKEDNAGDPPHQLTGEESDVQLTETAAVDRVVASTEERGDGAKLRKKERAEENDGSLVDQGNEVEGGNVERADDSKNEASSAVEAPTARKKPAKKKSVVASSSSYRRKGKRSEPPSSLDGEMAFGEQELPPSKDVEFHCPPEVIKAKKPSTSPTPLLPPFTTAAKLEEDAMPLLAAAPPPLRDADSNRRAKQCRSSGGVTARRGRSTAASATVEGGSNKRPAASQCSSGKSTTSTYTSSRSGKARNYSATLLPRATISHVLPSPSDSLDGGTRLKVSTLLGLPESCDFASLIRLPQESSATSAPAIPTPSSHSTNEVEVATTTATSEDATTNVGARCTSRDSKDNKDNSTTTVVPSADGVACIPSECGGPWPDWSLTMDFASAAELNSQILQGVEKYAGHFRNFCRRYLALRETELEQADTFEPEFIVTTDEDAGVDGGDNNSPAAADDGPVTFTRYRPVLSGAPFMKRMLSDCKSIGQARLIEELLAKRTPSTQGEVAKRRFILFPSWPVESPMFELTNWLGGINLSRPRKREASLKRRVAAARDGDAAVSADLIETSPTESEVDVDTGGLNTGGPPTPAPPIMPLFAKRNQDTCVPTSMNSVVYSSAGNKWSLWELTMEYARMFADRDAPGGGGILVDSTETLPSAATARTATNRRRKCLNSLRAIPPPRQLSSLFGTDGPNEIFGMLESGMVYHHYPPDEGKIHSPVNALPSLLVQPTPVLDTLPEDTFGALFALLRLRPALAIKLRRVALVGKFTHRSDTTTDDSIAAAGTTMSTTATVSTAAATDRTPTPPAPSEKDAQQSRHLDRSMTETFRRSNYSAESMDEEAGIIMATTSPCVVDIFSEGEGDDGFGSNGLAADLHSPTSICLEPTGITGAADERTASSPVVTQTSMMFSRNNSDVVPASSGPVVTTSIHNRTDLIAAAFAVDSKSCCSSKWKIVPAGKPLRKLGVAESVIDAARQRSTFRVARRKYLEPQLETRTADDDDFGAAASIVSYHRQRRRRASGSFTAAPSAFPSSVVGLELAPAPVARTPALDPSRPPAAAPAAASFESARDQATYSFVKNMLAEVPLSVFTDPFQLVKTLSAVVDRQSILSSHLCKQLGLQPAPSTESGPKSLINVTKRKPVAAAAPPELPPPGKRKTKKFISAVATAAASTTPSSSKCSSPLPLISAAGDENAISRKIALLKSAVLSSSNNKSSAPPIPPALSPPLAVRQMFQAIAARKEGEDCTAGATPPTSSFRKYVDYGNDSYFLSHYCDPAALAAIRASAGSSALLSDDSDEPLLPAAVTRPSFPKSSVAPNSTGNARKRVRCACSTVSPVAVGPAASIPQMACQNRRCGVAAALGAADSPKIAKTT